ncbi:hypothetical protein [uncultured Paracoccus sp.]|uniref:hypothetical protein n=1 Tax=uncultured Paracoccus sp. TaxID=189685 RepID=UPI002601A9B3|nr:hypothetical protein [uncultured Paracoccus sp.]
MRRVSERWPGVLFAAAATLCAAPALAADLPRYQVEDYCTQVSDVSGGSRMIYNSCIDMEQTAYDHLRGDWSGLPAQARRYCDEVARVTGGSYSILQGCIEMELGAGSSTPSFRY